MRLEQSIIRAQTIMSDTPPVFTPTPDQERALNTIITEPLVCLTGVAGAGKTALLKYLVSTLIETQSKANYAATITNNGELEENNEKARRKYEDGLYEIAADNARATYPVLATTGIASTLLGEGATTWQSWLGLGAPNQISDLKPHWCENMKPEKVKRLQRAKKIILEETSLLSPTAFELIDHVLRCVRHKYKTKGDPTDYANLPFGGVQIVLSGDFFQLPPVDKNLSRNQVPKLLIESPLFKKYGFVKAHLPISIRQKGDAAFVDLLNHVRIKRLDSVDRRDLKALVKPYNQFTEEFQKRYNTSVMPVKLFCTNDDVKQSNVNRLISVAAEGDQLIHYFQSTVFITKSDFSDIATILGTSGLDNTSYESYAQFDRMTGFTTLAIEPESEFPSDVVDKSDYNTPTRAHLRKLGFFHCGASIPDGVLAEPTASKKVFVSVDLNLNTSHELCAKTVLRHDMRNMLCVPLCIGAQVILTSNLNLNTGLVNGAMGIVVDFVSDRPILSNDGEEDLIAPGVKWPRVRFVNGQEVMIRPVLMEYGANMTNYVNHLKKPANAQNAIPPRTFHYGLPLLLAWSLTIHASQGQTLSGAYMNCSEFMPVGGFYTGMSRVTCRENIALSAFSDNMIRCNPAAIEYERSVTGGNVIAKPQEDVEDEDDYMADCYADDAE